MSIYITCVGVVAFLTIVSVVLWMATMKFMATSKNVDLVGGKLENSDASIRKAITHLKITNEWSDN